MFYFQRFCTFTVESTACPFSSMIMKTTSNSPRLEEHGLTSMFPNLNSWWLKFVKMRLSHLEGLMSGLLHKPNSFLKLQCGCKVKITMVSSCYCFQMVITMKVCTNFLCPLLSTLVFTLYLLLGWESKLLFIAVGNLIIWKFLKMRILIQGIGG